MKTFVEMVYALEQAKTDAAKAAVIPNLSAVGRQLVREALSPYRMFNIKQVTAPKSYAAKDAGHAPFLFLLEKLYDGSLRGNAAREECTLVLSRYTERTANALTR